MSSESWAVLTEPNPSSQVGAQWLCDLIPCSEYIEPAWMPTPALASCSVLFFQGFESVTGRQSLGVAHIYRCNRSSIAERSAREVSERRTVANMQAVRPSKKTSWVLLPCPSCVPRRQDHPPPHPGLCVPPEPLWCPSVYREDLAIAGKQSL